MLDELPKKSRRIWLTYVTMVCVAILFGATGGAMGMVFALPLLLPWSVLVPVLDASLELGVFQTPGVGLATLVAEGALNAYILLVVLRRLAR